jgi:hypothetical protein
MREIPFVVIRLRGRFIVDEAIVGQRLGGSPCRLVVVFQIPELIGSFFLQGGHVRVRVHVGHAANVIVHGLHAAASAPQINASEQRDAAHRNDPA